MTDISKARFIKSQLDRINGREVPRHIAKIGRDIVKNLTSKEEFDVDFAHMLARELEAAVNDWEKDERG